MITPKKTPSSNLTPFVSVDPTIFVQLQYEAEVLQLVGSSVRDG